METFDTNLNVIAQQIAGDAPHCDVIAWRHSNDHSKHFTAK